MNTNEQVLDFIKANPNSNKAAITAGTGIAGLKLFNLLKSMLKEGQILCNGDGTETTYTVAEPQVPEVATEVQPIVDQVATSETGTVGTQVSEEQNEQTEKPGAEVKQPVKKEEPITKETTTTTSRDNSKYVFMGAEYGKGPLVRAVVAKYVEDHPDTTYKQLKEIFPDTLMKRFGVFANEAEAKKLSGSKPRYFLKPEQMIKIKGQKEPIAVCNQWTAALVAPVILKAVKELGYKIK